MNIQELIEHYEKILDYGLLGVAEEKAYTEFVKKLKQLDEPQKPVIPQFVADWYEKNKDDFEGNLFRCINTISSMYEDEELNDFENWVIEAHTKPFQTLVNMHQFGYTVEKEKRYIVKIKNIGDGWEYLKWNSVQRYWYFGNKKRLDDVRLYHTLENLQKGGFGDVFVNPLFTIEEVE
jgi:gp178|nr:MAG TPA: Protein of unknown function (DUF1642) [Caudoviricetes sp.]